MPVAGSSVVIKVLRHSCQTILTVTDLIIDGWLLGFADWPHLTVLCNARRTGRPTALPLPPLGSSQTALSASQACSMLMQCDHIQPFTSLCHVKGIYILHYQCGAAALTLVLSAHLPGFPVVVSKPSQALKVINDLFQWRLCQRLPMLVAIVRSNAENRKKKVVKVPFWSSYTSWKF